MADILNLKGVLTLLKQEVEKAGGPSEWARKHGINRTYLSKVLHGHRDPTGHALLEALGVETIYRRRD
jgi:DNA-binding phage protein